MSHFVFNDSSGGGDNKVRITDTDNLAGFLFDKLQAGLNITLNVVVDAWGNQSIEISSAGGGGSLVAVSAADTTPNFLNPKIVVGSGIRKAITNPGGNEGLRLDAFGSSVTAADTNIGYLNDKITSGANITLAVLNAGGNERLQITATGGSMDGYLKYADIDGYAKKDLLDAYLTYLEIDGYAKKDLLDAYLTYLEIDGYALKTDLNSYALRSSLDAYLTYLEIDGYALKTDLDAYLTYLEIDGYALKTDLNSYALRSSLDAYLTYLEIDGYAKKDLLDAYLTYLEIDGYALKTDLNSYALRSSLDAYLTYTEIDGYAKKDLLDAYLTYLEIDGYALKTDLNSYALRSTLDAYGRDRQQLLFVGKHGNDGYSGLTPDLPYLTFGAALTAAATAVPTPTNRYTIVCQDAGTYNEQIVVDGYVDVLAPNATLSPVAAGTALTVNYESLVSFRAIIPQAAASIAVLKTNTGNAAPQVVVGVVSVQNNSVGCANISFASGGTIIFRCGTMYLRNGCVGVGSLAANEGHVHVYIGDIYFLGTNAFGVYLITNSDIIGTIEHILNDGGTGSTGVYVSVGTVRLNIQELNCDTAYNISGTGVINLSVNSLTGDEITNNEATRHIFTVDGPVGIGHVPQHVGDNDGYGIWSKRTSDSLALLSTRTDGSTNKSILMVADLNKATMDFDHTITEMGWMNDSDVYAGFWKFKQDQIEHADATVAELFGTEADGAAAVGVRLGSDNEFTTAGSTLLEVINYVYKRFSIDYSGNVACHMDNNGGMLLEDYITSLETIAAAASTIATISIPADCQIKAISGYVVTAIPTAVTFDVGVLGVTDRYADDISVAAGSSFSGMKDGVRYYAAATNIYITPSAPPAAATGQIRLVVHYMKVIPPTS